MKAKRNMATAVGDVDNLERGDGQPAIGTLFSTDPRAIWQFFACNADSSGQRKMTPTCIVNRKYPKVRDTSTDIGENIVLKSRKKKRRNRVSSLPSEQPQLRELLTGQEDMPEGVTGDTTKKKKKKKRVNKSVKRRLALAAIMELNLITAGLENRWLGSAELPTDNTMRDNSRINNSSSSYTASFAADRCYKGSHVRGAHSHLYPDDLNDIEPLPYGGSWNAPTALPQPTIAVLKPTASNAIRVENYRALQVLDCISYRTLELCTHTMRPVLSAAKQCTVMACSWDTGPALVSAAGSNRHVTAQDKLLLRREYSNARDRDRDRERAKDRDRDTSGRAVEEFWLLGSGIAEMFLLCPDTERLGVLAASLTSSAALEITLGVKRKATTINALLGTSNETVISSGSFTSDSTTTTTSQRGASGERAEGLLCSYVTKAQSGTSVLEQSDLRSSCTSSMELSVEGAMKKRRRKGKGKGKEQGSICNHQLNDSSQGYIEGLPPPLRHVKSSLLCSQAGGSTEVSHAKAHQEEGEGEGEVEEDSIAVTACEKSLMELTDTAPACSMDNVTSQISSSSLSSSSPLPLPPTATNMDDDIDAEPMTVSFADMFESLLSEKRKDME